VLPRSYQNILAHFDRFYVYDDGAVRGVTSWQLMPVFDLDNPDLCMEIISLSVRSGSKGQGIGRLLVEKMIGVIEEMRPHRIIVLTYYPEFFQKFGFTVTSKDKLYQKIYQVCINCTKHKSPLTCPEVAMESGLRDSIFVFLQRAGQAFSLTKGIFCSYLHHQTCR
jgi:amino-acid N-acetyltransferase